MTVQTMRNIDRLLGVPSCWIVAGILKFLPGRSADLHSENRINVLVVKFFGLGSIVLSTPALAMLRSRFPDSRISFLSFRSNTEFLERIPLIDEVVTIDPSSLRSFLRDVISLLGRLFRMRYDVVLDFEFFSKFSTALSGFSRAPYRIGFGLPAKWRSFVLTHSVPLVKGRHVREAFCSQVRALADGADTGEMVPPQIFEADAASLERKVRLEDQEILVVNVNAGDTFPERRWPPTRFAELISELAAEHEFTFVLTGTLRERQYVQEVIDETGYSERCRNVAGLLTIPELGALLQRSHLLISNDSGPLHLAASLDVAAIGLFGPESPEFYGPLSSSARSIYEKTECSPCMNVYSAKTFRCPYDAKCMKNIGITDVREIIEEVLATSWSE